MFPSSNDDAADQSLTRGAASEGYAPGWAEDALSMMGRRKADTRAVFVLPFLADGVRVLDVGCGPGTITLGLAKAVAPHGFALGIDGQRSQVELATEMIATAGSKNLQFEQGSVYDLPVPGGSIDVAFAHALFEHLGRPADALAELRRVLRPGGLLAISSSDWSAAVLNPRTPDVDAALRGHYLLRRKAGGDPFAGAGWRLWSSRPGSSRSGPPRAGGRTWPTPRSPGISGCGSPPRSPTLMPPSGPNWSGLARRRGAGPSRKVSS